MSAAFRVTVAKDLEDLVPTFLKNRVQELAALREALARGDHAEIARLGHRMKGVGISYGFERVSSLGQVFEDAAKAADAAALAAGLDEYAHYLGHLDIVYE